MKTTNHSYPDREKFIVQGCDAGIWLDSIFGSNDFNKAEEIMKEKKAAQGGQWRVALNKFFTRP